MKNLWIQSTNKANHIKSFVHGAPPASRKSVNLLLEF